MGILQMPQRMLSLVLRGVYLTPLIMGLLGNGFSLFVMDLRLNWGNEVFFLLREVGMESSLVVF